MQTLEGKTVLVTGASRGIGASTARACAKAGAMVIGHASAPSDQSRAIEKELTNAGGVFIYRNLEQEGAGTALMEAAIKASNGALSAIINNAGIYEPTPLDLDKDAVWQENWRRTLAVNVQAPADITRAAVAHFRKTGAGAIVNIASRAGHRGDGVDHAGYAASKGAVLAMTKTWARALAGENIELYAIAPGWVETRMAPEDIEARKRAVNEIPLGRVASPDEVANMAIFLISGQCPSAIGTTVDINGASYVR